MSEQFTFSDLGRVNWMPTLKLSLARGFFAGMVWAIVTSFGDNGPPIGQALAMPFIWAILIIPMALFTQLLGLFLGMIIPALGGLCNILGALMVCMGDPIVYLLNRSFPRLFDIADLGFFNFMPMIFITHPD